MFKKILHFVHSDTATVAVEFSLILIPFMITIMFVSEICRVIYISSSIDLILSESARKASISINPENYERYFNRELNARISQWPLLSKKVNTVINIKYCDDVNQVVTRTCVSNNGIGKPLAIYDIKTDYTPVFFILPTSMTLRELKRSALLIQESQRRKI